MTTSSQSVSDYFRAKLNAKAHGNGKLARRRLPPLLLHEMTTMTMVVV